MGRSTNRFLVSLLVVLASTGASAQSCAGEPSAGARAASGEKFRMIFEQCDVLAEGLTLHRASQLDLYDRRTASVGISMSPVEEDDGPAALARPEVAHRRSVPLAPPTRDAQRVMALAPSLTAIALAYDLDPLLLHAIAHVESRHNSDAVSKAGARGVMQVMPTTAKRFGVDNPERDLLDAETNLRASAALLQTLFRRYGNDTRLVLAAYNAGEGAVDKYGRNVPPYPQTQAYVRDVMAAHRRLTREFAVDADGKLVTRRAFENRPSAARPPELANPSPTDSRGLLGSQGGKS